MAVVSVQTLSISGSQYLRFTETLSGHVRIEAVSCRTEQPLLMAIVPEAELLATIGVFMDLKAKKADRE